MSTPRNVELDYHLTRVRGGSHWLQTTFGSAPRIAILTGSAGPVELSNYFNQATLQERALNEVFPTPVTDGHRAVIQVGRMGDTDVALVLGRTHFNEHGDPHETVMTVRSLIEWGCKKFIFTNLVGSLDRQHPVGSVSIIRDHVSLFSGCHPLIGTPSIIQEFGTTRFVNMSEPYSRQMIHILKDLIQPSLFGLIRKKEYPRMRDAIYSMVPGPNFETQADARVLKRFGINLMGMSIIPEIEVCAHAGVEACALSMVSNVVAERGVSHDANLRAIRTESPKFARLLADFVTELGKAA